MRDLGRRVARLETVLAVKPGRAQPVDPSRLSADLLRRLEEEHGNLSALSDADLEELEVAALASEEGQHEPH